MVRACAKSILKVVTVRDEGAKVVEFLLKAELCDCATSVWGCSKALSRKCNSAAVTNGHDAPKLSPAPISPKQRWRRRSADAKLRPSPSTHCTFKDVKSFKALTDEPNGCRDTADSTSHNRDLQIVHDDELGGGVAHTVRTT